MKVGFMRLHEDAKIPQKAYETDSGFDLHAIETVKIRPGGTSVIPTGIAVVLPEGHEAQVRPRSGITSKTKIRVQLGTIDNGYCGEIGIIVDNIATHDFETIEKGQRIAQLVVQPLPKVTAYEFSGAVETERGNNGFGSTGKE